MQSLADFRRASAAVAGLALLGAMLLPGAAVAADAAQGEILAKRWCASCHIVAHDQTRGADAVPAFASIAKRPDFSAGKIAKFLMDPHPRMPDMQLGRDESADLGAYIASLGK